MEDRSAASVSPHALVTALTSAIGLILRRMRAEANPGGLNVSQTQTLALLDGHGASTTAELARAQAMKPQSMSAVLAVLERQGLVERRAHATDGRRILFSLTDRGRDARRERSAAKHEWLLDALSRLDGADRQVLSRAAAIIDDLSRVPEDRRDRDRRTDPRPSRPERLT